MMNRPIGKSGEDIACEYLKNKGFRILGRNYSKKIGEIDIVASQGRILVLVEVKTLKFKGIGGLEPEDNLTNAKLAKMKKIAELFVAKHPELVTDLGWRLDLIAISTRPEGVPEIRHYENLF